MTTELDPQDIRWRVSNTWDRNGTKWGMLVGYIDARTCMDALDALDANWSAVHGDPIIVGHDLIGVPCALTVNGVTRSDVGMPSSQEPIKGAYSDALKRAAVHFGIGRELYELPKIAVECDVAANGKVKGPKALPVYRKGRWEIDRKVGWVKYDREPDEQPEREGGGASASTPNRPPAQASYRRDELMGLMREQGLDLDAIERYAAIVGIPKGQRATNEQMDALIDAVRGHGTDEPIEPPVARDGGPEVPSPAESGPEAVSPAASGPPPKPQTPEYGALSPVEKASARAYWADRRQEEHQETLAEALGAPAA